MVPRFLYCIWMHTTVIPSTFKSFFIVKTLRCVYLMFAEIFTIYKKKMRFCKKMCKHNTHRFHHITYFFRKDIDFSIVLLLVVGSTWYEERFYKTVCWYVFYLLQKICTFAIRKKNVHLQKNIWNLQKICGCCFFVLSLFCVLCRYRVVTLARVATYVQLLLTNVSLRMDTLFIF